MIERMVKSVLLLVRFLFMSCFANHQLLFFVPQANRDACGSNFAATGSSTRSKILQIVVYGSIALGILIAAFVGVYVYRRCKAQPPRPAPQGHPIPQNELAYGRI
jgi:hypothetical protein